MKHLLICLLLLTARVKAQKYDTIYVSNESTSYLLFDDPIQLYNIGNQDFIGQVDDPKMLFLKAKNSLAKATSLVVSHGENVFTGFIAYRSKPHPFYDYRKKDGKEASPNKEVETKLKSLKKLAPNVTFMAENQNVLVKMTHLYNDNKATYVRFMLMNQSSILYDLDYVSFAYIEERKRKSKKINTLESGLEEMSPLVIEEEPITQAGQSKEFFYAIPLYSTTANGYLQVIFREKAGVRSVTFKIPFSHVLKAALL